MRKNALARLVPVLFVAASGCTFLHRSTTDGFGVSYEQLTAMIADAEAQRAANGDLERWIDEHRVMPEYRGSWDLVIGELYARRSSAVVRDQTYVSLTGSLLAMGLSSKNPPIDDVGGVLGAAGWTLVSVCFLPIDVVAAPIWLGDALIGELGVSHDDVVRAATDMRLARELGYADSRVPSTGYMGWPRPYNRHVDVIGYDAEWLRRQPTK